MAASVRWKTTGRFQALGWLSLASALVVGLLWVDRDSLSRVPTQVATADWRLACVALALLASVEFAKALRWQALYGEVRPAYQRVLQAQVLGQAANALVPLRLGDVLRVSWAVPSPSGVARGTAALVLTKAVDAVILAGVIAWVFGPSLLAQAQLVPVVVLGLVVAIGLGLAQRYRSIGGGGLGAVRPLLAGAARYAQELHLATLAMVLATSAFAWIVGWLANLVVLAAVAAPPSPDFGGRILASAYVAGLLPAPPGRVGVFEGAVAAALVGGGMDLSLAIAAAVVLHVLQLLEVALLVLAATRWRR
jgi:uncharacterized membrane protein YbhN (UPF0104 family)